VPFYKVFNSIKSLLLKFLHCDEIVTCLCDLRNQTLHCIKVLSMKYKEKFHSVNIDIIRFITSSSLCLRLNPFIALFAAFIFLRRTVLRIHVWGPGSVSSSEIRFTLSVFDIFDPSVTPYNRRDRPQGSKRMEKH